MGIIQRIKNAYHAAVGQPVTLADRRILDFLGLDPDTPRSEISEATYYACIKVLSEAMGKMPLKYYRDGENGIERPALTDAARALSLKPNQYMTATTMWTLCEQHCQHYGNSFVYICSEFEKNGKYGGEYKIKGFYPLHPDYVTVMIDDIGILGDEGRIYYKYNRSGSEYIFKDFEILHFKAWYTKDGLIGIPTREVLRKTIKGANNAADCEELLYANGMHASMVMQYTGSFDDEKIAEIQRKFADRLTGPKAAGKVIPMPLGFSLQPLNMSMVDADFYNLRKYNARQIAAAMGIKPSHINDYENSKYASAESEALAFLTDTLSYRLKMYEDELNSKILTPSEIDDGCYYKFNEKSILRTDSLTQSEILKNYVQGGIYSPNEARAFLDKPDKEGGDQLLVNGSYVPITKAGAAYERRAS